MSIWEEGLEEYLIKFIKNPSDVSSIQEMYRIFSKSEAFQSGAAKSLLANESFKRLYETWHLPSPIDIPALLNLRESAFGYVYASHMTRNNLDPNFISEFDERNLLSYLWIRAKHVHDIGHILTGFDTSLMGEIGLKGFELAQYNSPSTAATVAAGLFSLTCLMPNEVENIYAQFFRGYKMGRAYPLLMSIRWDEEWSTDISALRQKYGIPDRLDVQ